MRSELTSVLCGVALLFAVPSLAQDDTPTPPPPVPPAAPHQNPRPVENTVGLGAGWAFPQSILEPNTVGVRFRFGNIALEPSLRVGGNGGGDASKSTVTPPGVPATVTDTQDRDSGFNASAGATVRYPLTSRGPVDLLVLAGAGISFGTTTAQNDVTNTARKDTQTTNTLTASLGYGLGLEWFIGHGLSLSADASNPLVSWSQVTSRRNVEFTNTTTNEVTTTVTDTNRNNVTGALVWAPTLRLMLFLYF